MAKKWVQERLRRVRLLLVVALLGLGCAPHQDMVLILFPLFGVLILATLTTALVVAYRHPTPFVFLVGCVSIFVIAMFWNVAMMLGANLVINASPQIDWLRANDAYAQAVIPLFWMFLTMFAWGTYLTVVRVLLKSKILSGATPATALPARESSGLEG